MGDAMDLPKAEIVQMVSDWMQEYADALGVANDSDQIGLAIEELQADRDRLAARVKADEQRIENLKAALETVDNDVRWFSQNVPPGMPAERLAIDRLLRDHKRLLAFFAARALPPVGVRS